MGGAESQVTIVEADPETMIVLAAAVVPRADLAPVIRAANIKKFQKRSMKRRCINV